MTHPLLELTHQLLTNRKRALQILDTAHAETRDLTLCEQLEFDALLVSARELEIKIQEREALRKA